MQAATDGERRGIGRYIKKKKLDPLNTYVPAVIAAKNQLVRAGSIMSELYNYQAIRFVQSFFREQEKFRGSWLVSTLDAPEPASSPVQGQIGVVNAHQDMCPYHLFKMGERSFAMGMEASR